MHKIFNRFNLILLLPLIFTFVFSSLVDKYFSHSNNSIKFNNINTEKLISNNSVYENFNLYKLPEISNNHYATKFKIDRITVKPKKIVNNDTKEPILNYDLINKNLISINKLSEKKKKFIKVVLPLIISQNQEILLDRNHLLKIREYLIKHKTINKKDQRVVQNLSQEYSIQNNNRHKIDIIDDLLISVDVIPNSIALAQAVNESGWGTSRFAKEYNALFGQYTFDENIGVVPSRRDKGKKHLIKHFVSIDQSIKSYLKNINTHFAYEEFRKLRNEIRGNSNQIKNTLLVHKLNTYAEDKNYVDTLIDIIKTNNLSDFDDLDLLLASS